MSLCNRDCFNCNLKDCNLSGVSDEERALSKERDIEAITSESNVSYGKKYYWKNREKCKKWSKETYDRDKEKYQEKNRKYYDIHKEKFREYNKRWKEEHKELIKQRQRQYYLNWKNKKEQNSV